MFCLEDNLVFSIGLTDLLGQQCANILLHHNNVDHTRSVIDPSSHTSLKIAR